MHAVFCRPPNFYTTEIKPIYATATIKLPSWMIKISLTTTPKKNRL